MSDNQHQRDQMASAQRDIEEPREGLTDSVPPGDEALRALGAIVEAWRKPHLADTTMGVETVPATWYHHLRDVVFEASKLFPLTSRPAQQEENDPDDEMELMLGGYYDR